MTARGAAGPHDGCVSDALVSPAGVSQPTFLFVLALDEPVAP